MVVWLMALMALGAGVLAWPQWVPIRALDGWLILGLGIAGALGQYLITEAFRLGEASLLAPLERSEEHTSELQSLMRNSYAVFCLKKKKNNTTTSVNSAYEE